MSERRYKWTDMSLLVLIMCLLEALVAFGLGQFPGEAYMLSLVLPITLIVMMRWGVCGLIHAGLGGAFYAVLYGGGFMGLVVYTLGNLGIALCLLMLHVLGKEKVRCSAVITGLYCVAGWLGMGLGRGGAAFVMGGGRFLDVTLRFLTTDALSAVIAAVAVLIARKQNGLFEDQKQYLARLADEMNNK